MNKGLETLEVYHLAMEIGEIVWKLVDKWDYFAKNTLGSNWVRSADFIAFNISEGYGRFTFKDKRHFFLIARGSLSETISGGVKALNRQLISKEEFDLLEMKTNICYPKLNSYIDYVARHLTNSNHPNSPNSPDSPNSPARK